MKLSNNELTKYPFIVVQVSYFSEKEVNVSFISGSPWLLLCWQPYLYLRRTGGSSFDIPVWHFHLSKGSQYFFYHNTPSLFISRKQTWLQMKGNIALRLPDLPKMSCSAVFFLSMCRFTFLFIRSRYIGNFSSTSLTCTLSNWLADGGVVAGGGMVQKGEVASPHKSSDGSWSLLFEKASSCSTCSGNANVVGTSNHICEWYTLKYKNTGNLMIMSTI